MEIIKVLRLFVCDENLKLNMGMLWEFLKKNCTDPFTTGNYADVTDFFAWQNDKTQMLM